MGCCGGKKTKSAPAKAKSFIPKGVAQLVNMVYLGPKDRAFELVGGVTRERYCVPADGMRLVCLVGSSVPGVRPADVGWFRIVGGGAHFVLEADVIAEPEPEPVVDVEPEAELVEPEGEAEE